jgi:Glutamate-cysteine ligase family 2(GCS2)
MRSGRDDAACSPTGRTVHGLRAAPAGVPVLARGPAPGWAVAGNGPARGARMLVKPEPVPLTESGAEEHVHGICFKTGPPSQLGVELEWLVRDGRNPALPVDQQRVTAALGGLCVPGALPGCGRITTEPGGQVELSSAPAVGLAGCITTASHDLATIRGAVQAAGLCLAGEGLDPLRSPRRVLDEPRYAAMEEFFNRAGLWAGS